MGAARRLEGWLTSRGGGVETARAVLAKPLPRNISWMHTLGALLIAYLAFQALTGVLLGLYYSAAPESAYDSVRYVREELFLGDLVYKLHRAGAAFVLVTAFLHLARSYFMASYKPPRELLWLAGVALLGLLVLAAFTGQLLPWDQRGWWATVVGIEIASGVPWIGERVRELLTGGYGDIGPVTLSRFYVLHVGVVPIAILVFAAWHLAILQRVGSSPPASGDPAPYRSFYPRQALKDVLVCAAGALALVGVAAAADFPDTGPADPSAGDFVPRPEWYFYAHYELLRLPPGHLQVLGTFVLPALFAAALVFLPFVDRGTDRRPSRRKLAIAAGLLACAAIVGLTARGLAREERAAAQPPGEEEPQERDLAAWGSDLFWEKRCIECHSVGGEGAEEAPALDRAGLRFRPEWLRAWIRDPLRFDPQTEMPPFEGTERELEAVIAWLLSLE